MITRLRLDRIAGPPLLVLTSSLMLMNVLACSRQGKSDIVINEIYANGPGDDWIELFNRSREAKDLSSYRLYDDPTKQYAFPDGTRIEARAFLVFLCNPSEDSASTGFGLSSAGETVFLEDMLGVIDKVSYPFLDNGQSYGRVPDGSDSFKVMTNSSEGDVNGRAPRAPSSVVIDQY